MNEKNWFGSVVFVVVLVVLGLYSSGCVMTVGFDLPGDNAATTYSKNTKGAESWNKK